MSRPRTAERLEQRTLLAAGVLDTSFSSDGFAVTSITDNKDTAEAVAALDDGSVVAAGPALAGDHNFNFALAKYTESGDLDTAFGQGGIVQVDFGKDRSDEAFALEVLSDGKMLVGGYTNIGSKYDIFKHDKVFALARLNPDGTLDSTFGDQGGKVKGVVITDLNSGTDERINDVAVQADGKIVAVGRATGDIGVVRYNADGSLDSSFGNSGVVVTDAGGFERDAKGVVLQQDDAGNTTSITVAGTTDANGTDEDFLLARYTTDGILDSQFGTSGLVLTDFQETERANDIAVQEVNTEEHLVVTGDFSYDDPNGTRHVGAATARYTLDGTLDGTFGDNGFVIEDRTSANPEGVGGAAAVTVDGSQRIVITGGYWNTTTEEWDTTVIRYTPDGAADTGFGEDLDGDGTLDGITVTSVSTSGDQGHALALDPLGRIVVAGHATDPSDSDREFAVARYLAEAPNNAPTVSITDPSDGDVVSGTQTVTATASDDDGTVSQVEFFVSGDSIGVDSDGSDGWSASWDTTSSAEGTTTVTSRATDDGGASSSDSVSVTVDNNAAPTVSITSPSDGATVSGTITVQADASDTDGTVSQAEFFVDGTSIGTDADGSDGWSISWDTTSVSNGGRTVTAVATDDYGESADHTISVTVDNPSQSVMYVADIAFESRGKSQHRVVVDIRQDDGDGVGETSDASLAGVQVTVEFSGTAYTGVTDENGIFRTEWIKDLGSGNHQAEVTDLVLTEFSWDPLLDLESDSDGDGLPDDWLTI